MKNPNYIEELKLSESLSNPDFVDGLTEGLSVALYIAQENNIDLHSLPKFVELQDFVLKRLKDA